MLTCPIVCVMLSGFLDTSERAKESESERESEREREREKSERERKARLFLL